MSFCVQYVYFTEIHNVYILHVKCHRTFSNALFLPGLYNEKVREIKLHENRKKEKKNGNVCILQLLFAAGIFWRKKIYKYIYICNLNYFWLCTDILKMSEFMASSDLLSVEEF